MNLRAGFPSLQLLFVIGSAIASLPLASVHADVVTMNDGSRRETKVMGVVGNSLQIQVQIPGAVGGGTIGLPLNAVKDVQMAAPAEYPAAMQAIQAKDLPKAMKLLNVLLEKYKGVPVEWAQQSTGALADLYVTTGDLARAETALKEYQRLYPNSGSMQSEIGMARIALFKKQYDVAKQKLEPIIGAALKEKNVSRSNGMAYSQAFLVRGEIKEKQNDLPGALEDYLRTVTLFYHDPLAVASAREKAEALESQKVIVP